MIGVFEILKILIVKPQFTAPNWMWSIWKFTFYLCIDGTFENMRTVSSWVNANITNISFEWTGLPTYGIYFRLTIYWTIFTIAIQFDNYQTGDCIIIQGIFFELECTFHSILSKNIPNFFLAEFVSSNFLYFWTGTIPIGFIHQFSMNVLWETVELIAGEILLQWKTWNDCMREIK